ncbi:MAG: hypothetical protein JNL33_10105 [Betaproteobacteria bacterium]|nr:hypothetical protein [Betaproteobacteria bacterium]
MPRLPVSIDRLALILPLALACLPSPGAAQTAEDTLKRVQKLESVVESLGAQLDALRKELQEARGQLEAARPPPAAQDTAGPPPTRRELDQALATAQEAKEQAASMQQRFEQQGVQTTFTDGLTFQDPRGRWGLRVMGRAQLDYRHFLGAEEGFADTFSVRRARLGAQATLFKDYTVQVEGEFSGSSVTMTNGFLEIGWFPAAKIRMGQFKPQFGLEQTLLDLQSDFQERSLTQNLLDGNGLNYDRGIMVHGAPWRPVYYSATFSNGTGVGVDDQGRNAAEARADTKDVTLRGVVDFAQLMDWRDAVLHAGVSWKAGQQANRQGAQADAFAAPAFRTEARGLTFFTPQSFFGAGGSTGEIDRTLEAAELTTSWRSLRFTGEWWKGTYAGVRTPTAGTPESFSRDITASYVSLQWLATGEVWSDYYAGGYWQKVRPNNRFSMEPGGGWGAVELGLRYSRMDATDFRVSNTPGTGQMSSTSPVTQGATKAEAYTAQIKWIHNSYSRWLLSYVRTRFDMPVIVNGVAIDREEALLLRAQVDF